MRLPWKGNFAHFSHTQVGKHALMRLGTRFPVGVVAFIQRNDFLLVVQPILGEVNFHTYLM